MATEEWRSLRDVLKRILPLFSENLDFTRTDPEGITEIVQRLTAAAVTFNLLAINDLGGRLGPQREPGLLEQAVGAAFQTFGDIDPHPHPFQKAAMLLRGITAGHPFADGNKRTGFFAAMYYLEQIGYPPPDRLPIDEVVAFSLKVSGGTMRDIEAIASELSRFWNQPATL